MTEKAEGESVEGSRLLKAVEAVAIAPEDAKDIVRKYREQAREAKPGISKRELQEVIAEKIVSRYAWFTTTSGAASALPGIVPGLGTAAVAGTAFGDAVFCMKFQLDMCMCLAEAFDYDINSEDARHLALFLSAGGALEKAGVEVGVQIAGKAGVKLLKQYLKGAALQVIKELFKKLGLVFTRKALEKAIPFGVGVVLGSTANYAMTRYVGSKAKDWFLIDRDLLE